MPSKRAQKGNTRPTKRTQTRNKRPPNTDHYWLVIASPFRGLTRSGGVGEQRPISQESVIPLYGDFRE
jgi:hypothetical protein